MTFNPKLNQEQHVFKEDIAYQNLEARNTPSQRNKFNSNLDNGSMMKSIRQSSAFDQAAKSRSKIIDGFKQAEQGEDEEFNAKFALLDAETTPSNHTSFLKAPNFTKKKSLDSWDQEDPGFSDVRSFGNKLSAFKSKQFYQGNRQYPYRNGQNYTYRFGNRSNFHFGGGGGGSQRSPQQNETKEGVGELVVSSTKYVPKQYSSPRSANQQIQNKQFTPNIQTYNPNILNKSQDQQDAKNNKSGNSNYKINDEQLMNEGKISDEDERNSQGFRITQEQFQKWEKKEQRDDCYLNTTKKKYGLASTITSVVQMPQNGLHSFHFNSASSIQPMNEIKIYGNTFNSLKKEQDLNSSIQKDISLPSVTQSKLKKIDLNTNLQIPNQGGPQILFPSSLNINFQLSNNQQINEQQQQQQSLLRQKKQQENKQYINYPKLNAQKDEEQNTVAENNKNENQIFENPVNFPQIEINDQKNIQEQTAYRKETYERAQNGAHRQIFNMDSLKITPIHSERIYHQVEPESDISPIGRVIDLNNSSQLKSKSLSPLIFPKHRAIPPMRMKYKKKEKEESQIDQNGVKNNLNGIGEEDILQQSQLLLIKNITPKYKVIQNQKQIAIPNTHIHSPASMEQIDQLLNIISPSLYSSSLNAKKDQNNKLIDIQGNKNDSNEGLDQKSDSQSNENPLLNLPGDNPKMKIFSLKFNGGQNGPINQPTKVPQKYIKQKQNNSPRVQSPIRNLKNQNQNTSIPPLIVHQFHQQAQTNIIENNSHLKSPNKRDQAQYFQQTIENLQKQKILQKGQNNQSILGNLLTQNNSFVNPNYHHIDFMDFVQGKSASFVLKQSHQAEKIQIDQNKQKIEVQKEDQQDQKLVKTTPSSYTSNNLIKKVSSQSKFIDRKLSPNPVRKVKTAFMPNSQSQTNLSLNSSFQNQGKSNKNNKQGQNSFINDKTSIVKGSQIGTNLKLDDQFVITNSYKQQSSQSPPQQQNKK